MDFSEEDRYVKKARVQYYCTRVVGKLHLIIIMTEDKVRVGVLALQGAFEEHQTCLEAVGCETVQVSCTRDVVSFCHVMLYCVVSSRNPARLVVPIPCAVGPYTY